MPDMRQARAFYQSLGSPVDVTAVREIGWRKLASGATTFVVDFTIVPTNEQIKIEAAPTCPKCGETMEKKQNRTTKQWFWGCPNWQEH